MICRTNSTQIWIISFFLSLDFFFHRTFHEFSESNTQTLFIQNQNVFRHVCIKYFRNFPTFCWNLVWSPLNFRENKFQFKIQTKILLLLFALIIWYRAYLQKFQWVDFCVVVANHVNQMCYVKNTVEFV